jgi:hypothetical protein
MPGLLLIDNNGYVDNRAVFNAVSTTCTKIHVNTACPLFDFDFEISCRSFNRLKICIRDDFDVKMPADLDQFG